MDINIEVESKSKANIVLKALTPQISTLSQYVDINSSDENITEIILDNSKKRLSTRTIIIGSCLFILITITLAILIVCFTASKRSNICRRSFKRITDNLIQYDSQPRSLALGDFDQDSYLDAVVANSGKDNIGIFFGKSNGTFLNQITYSTGSQSKPYSVVVSHFNQDNYLDIAVANYGTHSIGLFFGKYNGTFDGPSTFSTEVSRSIFLTVADLNNDIKQDIVVVNYGTNDIGIYLGYGNGTFTKGITYSTGYDSIPWSLVIGDFDDDNHLDIAVANSGTDNIAIFLGYGNGSFRDLVQYMTTSHSQPYSVAVGDFNNDDHLDLVVANYGLKRLGIFYGYGNGSFADQELLFFGTDIMSRFVTTGDLNNDNQNDIIIIDAINSHVHILPSYGNGTFFNLTTYITDDGTYPYEAAIGDFNHDNQSDLAVINYGSNELHIFIGYYTSYSVTQRRFSIGRNSYPQSLALGDFNNDQIIDIVVPEYSADSIGLLFGYGNGSFTTNISYSLQTGSAPRCICTGDFNNDSQIDIAVANYGLSTIGILFNYDNGSFSSMITYSTGNQSYPIFIATNDFNHDYILDIVVANVRLDNVGIFLGYSDGSFTPIKTYATGTDSDPAALAIADFNNDTQLDLAVANSETGNVGILFGNGDGTFQTILTYSTGFQSHPDSIIAGDLNNDYWLDIIVADSTSDNIAILYGYLNGTFKRFVIHTELSFSNPSGLALGDVNYDNRPDIIVTNPGTDTVGILVGTPDGSFTLGRLYLLVRGADPKGIVIADFDNNTRWDLAIVESGIGTINVLMRYVQADFTNQTIYSTGNGEHPHAVTVGDFNNDNRTDIAIANYGSDNIGVVLGYGNGSFTSQKTSYVGFHSHPGYVTVGDFNQDNQSDIVVASANYDGLIVLNGNGNGTFINPQIYPTKEGSQPAWIATGDFDNDQRIDFVVANQGRDNIGVLLNYDYNTFQDQKTYSNPYSLRPSAIITHDFNNDTYLDIATAFAGYDSVGLLFGYGNGTFNDIVMYSVGYQSYPYEMIGVDINHDHILDIIVANAGSSTIGILLGLVNGTFAPVMLFSTGIDSEPYGVSSGDFNLDNHTDIVVANYHSDSIGILLGYGNGTFTSVVIYSTDDGSRPQSVAVADFNKDDILDIVVANYRKDNVGLFLGNGDGTFQQQITFSTGYHATPTFLLANDFNNDNMTDIAVANNNNDNIGILYGYRNGTFASVFTYTTGGGSSPHCIRSGHFNRDSTLDIAIVSPGTNTIMVLYGLGDGRFLLGPSYSVGMKAGPISIAIGDFNNDGKLDITTANYLINNVGVHISEYNQKYGGVISHSTGSGSRPCSIAVSDFNNDQRSDVVVANYGSDSIAILLGYGDGTFTSLIIYSMGDHAHPIAVSVGDLNYDNQSDIVVINSETNNVYILLGYGNGNFTISFIYSTGYRSRPYAVTIADYNNDNILDLIIVTAGTSLVLSVHGYGNGTFGNETSYAMGFNYDPYAVAVGDFNGDGWIDIAVANYGGDYVEILLQIC